MLLPLSLYQTPQLEFLERGGRSGFGSNLSLSLRLRGPWNATAMGRAIALVMGRHEGLRMRLDRSSGRLRQVFAPAVPQVELQTRRLDGIDAAKKLVERRLRETIDLGKDGPVAYEVIELAPDDHVLLIILHHAATDTHADDLFIHELLEAYSCYIRDVEPGLPEAMKFSDLVWNEVRAGRKLNERQLEQWREVLQGSAAPVPRAPGGTVLPPDQRGQILMSSLDGPATSRLEDLATSARVSVPCLIYAVAVLAASREFGLADVRLLVTYSGRDTNALKSLGAATSRTFPMRIRLFDGMTVGDLAAAVKGAYMRGAIGSRPPFTYLRALSQLQMEEPASGDSPGTDAGASTRVDLMVTDALLVSDGVECPDPDLRVSRVMPGPLLERKFELVDARDAPYVMPLDILVRRDLEEGADRPLTFVAVFDAQAVTVRTARALLDRMRRMAAAVASATPQTAIADLEADRTHVDNRAEKTYA